MLTLERRNANANAAKPTGQWKLHTSKKEAARKLTMEELLSELEKRGLTLDRATDIWSRTDGRGGSDKVKLQTDEGEEVVLDKQKLAEKLVRYDSTQACWGRFIGDDQRCGTPVGLVPGHLHAQRQCRTAKHYCKTCLEALRVPADRVFVVAREDAEGTHANGNQPVWSESGGRKYRSFNTCAPCARKDKSIVVLAVADAPAADAGNAAPAPLPSALPIPGEWLHSGEGAGYVVVLKYMGGSRDFEPMRTMAQCGECEKWRVLRWGQKRPSEDDEWRCEMNKDVCGTIRTTRPLPLAYIDRASHCGTHR